MRTCQLEGEKIPSAEEGIVKLMRSPIDTHCGDCEKELPFGIWVYYNTDSGDAVCVECGVKKGWTSKQRVTQIVTALELREDIKALRKQSKAEADALVMLQDKIDLYRLGERDPDLEQEIMKLMRVVEDYLKQCGSVNEKEGLAQVFDAIKDCQALQKEIREQIESRWVMMDRRAAKKKKAQAAIPPAEVEDE